MLVMISTDDGQLFTYETENVVPKHYFNEVGYMYTLMQVLQTNNVEEKMKRCI